MRAALRHGPLLAVIYIAFVSLGLPDSVLGVAWPAMRADFAQPLQAAGLVFMVVTGCSALSGFASGWVLARLGTGKVVALSGLLTGGALLGFALAPGFLWIVLLAVPLGLGGGAVDASLNHYVADHYSSRHMNWLHGCWGVGATLGPALMAAALLRDAGWRGGYLGIGAIQLVLALLFFGLLRLWPRGDAGAGTAAAASDEDAARSGSDRAPTPPWAAWLAPGLFMVYASAELGTGLWIASILVETRGIAAGDAGFWVSCYFGAIMAGRFAIGTVSARWSNRRIVQGGLLLALAGALLFSVPGLPAALSLAGPLLMGLGLAPIYPSLMHETTRRFDPATARAVVGRQVALASIGASLGPAALGVLGAWLGLGAVMPAVVLALLTLIVLSRWLDRVT